MKKVLLFAVLGLFALTVAAQENFNEKKSYVVERAKNNWFLDLGVSANVYVGQQDNIAKFGKRFAPGGYITAGKWVTPWVGFKFGLDFTQYKGAAYYDDANFVRNLVWKPDQTRDGLKGVMKQKWFAFNPHVDIFFSMTNMMGQIKENRLYDLIFQVGAGFMANSGNKVMPDYWNGTQGYGKHVYYAPTINIGLINKFNVSDACDINIDIKGGWVGNDFDGQVCAMDGTQYKAGDFFASIGLGVTCKFKSTKHTEYKPWIIKDTEESEACYAAYKKLEAEKAAVDADNKALRDELENLKKNPVIIRDTVVLTKTEIEYKEKPRTMLGYVEFANGSAKISAADKAKLADIAEQIKAKPNCQYEICGYADNTTGSKAINDRLRNQRADAAIKVLQDCGVSPNILKKATNDGKPAKGISPRAIVINSYDCK